MQPILKINLTTRETDIFQIPKEWEHDYLGGASLGARLLFDTLTRDLDPLSPAAPLLMMTGPLTGTTGPAVGRFVVCGKSPLTGLWAESNCGGFWGPELRTAGYDGLWVTGKAERPVYIWINDQVVEFREASDLWGQDTYEVQKSIKASTGVPGAKVLTIGTAGEALIPFSILLCDHGRVAGRTGLGAVMGSKNLKAIAVKGTGVLPIFDPGNFSTKRAESNRILKADPMTSMLSALGTAGAADYFNYLGEQPKKYFSAGVLDGADNNSGASVAETILVGRSACHGCVIACGRVVRLEDGQKRKGPEYETLIGFGPNLGLTDPAIATRLGELCDRYGVDVISMSGTIGLAFRLFELGIIGTSDTNGLELTWGNAKAVEECIHLAVNRTGFGQFLAAGSRILAEHFGVPDEAIQVNGLELAYHDPRGASGMAIVYATSPRGACHNQSDYFLADIGQVDSSLGLEYFDRQAGAIKSANVARHQDFRTAANSLVLCILANVPPETLVNLINSACGYDWEIADFLRCGERSWNLKRLINFNLGLTRENDILPKPILQPYQDGGSSAYVIPFDDMMQAYYDARGWDSVTGYPTTKKLVELGLLGLAKTDC
jgi:aldehyde:ferredoxin oxidoreductase